MLIRSKIFFSLLLLSLLPLAVILMFTENIAEQKLKRDISHHFEHITREKANAINYILDSRINETRLLARHPDIVTAVRVSNARYTGQAEQRVMQGILQHDEAWINSKGDTAKAREIANNELSALLTTIQGRRPEEYGEIFVTDRLGATIAMTRTLSDYYQADEYWWQQGSRKGETGAFLDDRGYDETAGSIVVGVTVPILEQGELIGVFKINYRVKSILSVVSRDDLDIEQEILLIRSSGGIISSSADQPRKTLFADEQRAIEQQRPGWWEGTVEGTEVVGAYSPVSHEFYARKLKGIKGIKGEESRLVTWYVVTETDKEIAFQALNVLRNTAVGLGLGALLLAAGLGIWLSRAITRPLSALTKGADTVGSGDLQYRIGLRQKDEFGRLATSFNGMVERLQQTLASRDELDLEVERRKQTEHALRERDATSRSLLESTAEGIIGVDCSGSVTFVNPAAAQQLGYDHDELLGRALHPLVHHSYRDGSTYPLENCPMYYAMTEGVSQQINDEFLWRKDGSGFPVTYSSNPIFRGEQIDGAVIAFTDITQLIQAEKELAESRLIRQSNKLKRAFIANVSHELRTPLNIMVSMENILVQEGMTPKQKEHMDSIRQARQRLNELINGMLEFSQLDAGKAELDLQPTDLRRVLADVATAMQEEAQQKGLHFIMDVDEHVPKCLLADGKRIGAVLTYITDNAIKFTHSGKVTIRLTAAPEEADVYRVVITVKDTGVGMKNDLTRLANYDFIQADESLSRRHGGIGLGLSLSRNNINLMGGSLEIESELGKGTLVRIELLLKKVDKEESCETVAEVIQSFDMQEEPADEPVTTQLELTVEQCLQLKTQLDELAESVTTDYSSALTLMTSMLASYQGSVYIDTLNSISSKLQAFEADDVIAACRTLLQELSEVP